MLQILEIIDLNTEQAPAYQLDRQGVSCTRGEGGVAQGEEGGSDAQLKGRYGPKASPWGIIRDSNIWEVNAQIGVPDRGPRRQTDVRLAWTARVLVLHASDLAKALAGRA